MDQKIRALERHFYPILVEKHPLITDKYIENNDNDNNNNNNTINDEIKILIDQITDRLSLHGFAFGYVGAIIVLLICIFILSLKPISFKEMGNYGISTNENIIFNQEKKITEFKELWARDITNINIYWS